MRHMSKLAVPVSIVAERLGIDRRRVLRMVQRGTLKPVQKLPGETGAYLFDPEDVERLEADRWAAS